MVTEPFHSGVKSIFPGADLTAATAVTAVQFTSKPIRQVTVLQICMEKDKSGLPAELRDGDATSTDGRVAMYGYRFR